MSNSSDLKVALLRMNKFFLDGLSWIFLMFILSFIALTLLLRDAHKQYGAISFGVFPEFTAVDPQGRGFDQHRLKGQLSAVIISDDAVPDDVIVYLHRMSQLTASGKKYLKSLILTAHAKGVSDQWFKYLTLSPEEFTKLYNWKSRQFKSGVILIDQDKVVRGVFDINDKSQRLNFESAVRGIL
jgi:hypothetical protein